MTGFSLLLIGWELSRMKFFNQSHSVVKQHRKANAHNSIRLSIENRSIYPPCSLLCDSQVPYSLCPSYFVQHVKQCKRYLLYSLRNSLKSPWTIGFTHAWRQSRISENLKNSFATSNPCLPPKSSKSQAIWPGSKQIVNRITIMASVLMACMFSFLLFCSFFFFTSDKEFWRAVERHR